MSDGIMNLLFSVTPCLRGEVLVCERPGDRSSKLNLGHCRILPPVAVIPKM